MSSNRLMTIAEIKADIARADEIQKQMRRDAPTADVNAPYEDPRDRQVRRYVPESVGTSRNPKGPKFKIVGGVGATMSARYTAEDKYRDRLNQGWKPVVDETGQIVQQNGDMLMSRPIQFSQRQIERSAATSRQRVKMKDAETADNPLMNEAEKHFKKEEPTTEDGATVTTSNAKAEKEN